MGCTVKCGSQGLAKGKRSLEQRVARGQGQMGVVQRDPLLQTATVFCVTAGTGCWVIPAFFPCLI